MLKIINKSDDKIAGEQTGNPIRDVTAKTLKVALWKEKAS